MLKNIVMCLCVVGVLWANERSLHLEHNDKLREQNRNLLSQQHYILKSFPSNEYFSVYVSSQELSIYSQEGIHTLCQVQREEKNIEIAVQHLYKEKRVSYRIVIANNHVEFLATNKQREAILEYASMFTQVNHNDKFLLQIATPIEKISKKLFSPERAGYQKIRKAWTMEKSSGDSSVYLTSGNLKIVDYGVFVSSKAKNVAYVRVKGSLVNDNLLKISAVQITYHGSKYWVKGEATLVCQQNK